MYCDNCIYMLLNNLTGLEVRLLSLMKNNNLINAQMSNNENELLDLVNTDLDEEVSIYTLRKMIYRLTAVGFISGSKFTTMKYYLNENGMRAVKIFGAMLKKQLSQAQEDTKSNKKKKE